mmetsp:Transcript_3099/g.3656  ORF Transcript_3099/g.3656 Transcript_3099/m.3656 type:complete len:682 (+) Transcript_3099:50-2095(+)
MISDGSTSSSSSGSSSSYTSSSLPMSSAQEIGGIEAEVNANNQSSKIRSADTNTSIEGSNGTVTPTLPSSGNKHDAASARKEHPTSLNNKMMLQWLFLLLRGPFLISCSLLPPVGYGIWGLYQHIQRLQQMHILQQQIEPSIWPSGEPHAEYSPLIYYYWMMGLCTLSFLFFAMGLGLTLYDALVSIPNKLTESINDFFAANNGHLTLDEVLQQCTDFYLGMWGGFAIVMGLYSGVLGEELSNNRNKRVSLLNEFCGIENGGCFDDYGSVLGMNVCSWNDWKSVLGSMMVSTTNSNLDASASEGCALVDREHDEVSSSTNCVENESIISSSRRGSGYIDQDDKVVTDGDMVWEGEEETDVNKHHYFHESTAENLNTSNNYRNVDSNVTNSIVKIAATKPHSTASASIRGPPTMSAVLFRIISELYPSNEKSPLLQQHENKVLQQQQLDDRIQEMLPLPSLNRLKSIQYISMATLCLQLKHSPTTRRIATQILSVLGFGSLIAALGCSVLMQYVKDRVSFTKLVSSIPWGDDCDGRDWKGLLMNVASSMLFPPSASSPFSTGENKQVLNQLRTANHRLETNLTGATTPTYKNVITPSETEHRDNAVAASLQSQSRKFQFIPKLMHKINQILNPNGIDEECKDDNNATKQRRRRGILLFITGLFLRYYLQKRNNIRNRQKMLR